LGSMLEICRSMECRLVIGASLGNTHLEDKKPREGLFE
jgi:hypothetical protein